MQFARSLQTFLFASFTSMVGIAPLVFLVGYSEFIILEMSSLFTKLKSNNCVVSTDDSILTTFDSLLEATTPFSTSIVLSSKFVVLFIVIKKIYDFLE